MDKKDLAILIRSFVIGTVGPWDWDDFLSVSQEDPEIEALREEIWIISDKYPSTDLTHWCNEEGIRALLEIADTLSPPPTGTK